MNLKKRFLQYARDFEVTYADDDWSRLEPYFTEDAVYESSASPSLAIDARGRDAVLAAMRQSVDSFDRLYDSRRIEIVPPIEEEDGAITIRWAAVYTLAGAPDLELRGTERAEYRGDRICRLVDGFEAEEVEVFEAWMREHGAKLTSTST